MKVALVHDYLNQYGGAERVLEVLMEIFPEAPIFTLFYDKNNLPFYFQNKKIFTSFLNEIPGAKTHHRWFFPLMPLAIEKWNFSQFDLVISSSASFAKGIKTNSLTKHIAYIHTPTRFLWGESEQRLKEELPFYLRPLAKKIIEKLRRWDFQAAQRPDILLANSQYIKNKIEKDYKRPVQKIIYPPVEIKYQVSSIEKQEEITKPYFIIVSRLIPYKRIDLAIQACEALKINLKIIGAGRDEKRLKKIAGKYIEFLGKLPDQEKNIHLANAKAFLMPQLEDFGIAPLEAMACGIPVIAYKAGGALEIVKENENGIFFCRQTLESLIEAIKQFEKISFNPQKIRESVKKFSKENFKKEFLSIIN